MRHIKIGADINSCYPLVIRVKLLASGAYVCIPLVEYLLSQLNCSALEYFPILGAVIVVIANLSRERYEKMTQGYEEEQERLIAEVETPGKWVENEEDMDENMDSFLEVVHRYMDVPELTPTIVNEYIKKIIVYAPDKSSGHRQQKIQIIWNFLEEINIPDTEKTFVSQKASKMHKPA